MGWFKRMLGEEVEAIEYTHVPKKRAPRRNFGKLYPLDAKVKRFVTTNPKRRGTEAHEMYDKYEFCHTVSDCLAVGMTYRMIDGDVGRGYIEVASGSCEV